MSVTVAYVSRAFMVGVDAKQSEAASTQLVALFERGCIDNEVVQVMALGECRHETAQRLASNGFVSKSRYSTGDVYGKGLPSHVVFVVGVEEEIIDDKMQQVIGRVSEWQLAVD